MIATFSPPIKATAKKDSLPRVIVGVFVDDDKLVQFITVDGDGEFGIQMGHELNVDWRFDIKAGIWGDVNGPPEEEEDDA